MKHLVPLPFLLLSYISFSQADMPQIVCRGMVEHSDGLIRQFDSSEAIFIIDWSDSTLNTKTYQLHEGVKDVSFKIHKTGEERGMKTHMCHPLGMDSIHLSFIIADDEVRVSNWNTKDRQTWSIVSTEMVESYGFMNSTWENFHYEDCYLGFESQTDDFLHGIVELRDYVWNNKTKTAYVNLGNGDSLIIQRLNCHAVGLEVEFHLHNHKDDYKDWSKVLDKVLWVSRLLHEDFQYDDVAEALENGDYEYGNDEYEADFRFTSDYLSTWSYEVDLELRDEVVIIKYGCSFLP